MTALVSGGLLFATTGQVLAPEPAGAEEAQEVTPASSGGQGVVAPAASADVTEISVPSAEVRDARVGGGVVGGSPGEVPVSPLPAASEGAASPDAPSSAPTVPTATATATATATTPPRPSPTSTASPLLPALPTQVGGVPVDVLKDSPVRPPGLD